MTRVLVVEDNRGDFRLIQILVRRMGPDAFDLTHATALAQALEHIKSETLDAILLDLGLPDTVDFEGIRRLRRFAPDTPIVVLTGHTDDTMAKNALREGAEDYLVKGEFNSEALRRTVMYAIERRQSVRLREQLTQADRLAYIGKLAAGVAHEINNPAAVILGNTAMMKEYIQDINELCTQMRDSIKEDVSEDTLHRIDRFETLIPTLTEMIEDNHASIRRVADTVRRLGSFSAMQRQHLEIIQMDEIVQDACRLANADFKHRLVLEQDLKPVSSIVGDRGRLTQVIVNLLVNAAHAMESVEASQRRLKVTVDENETHVIVTVRDTGMGIAPEHRQRILEPFFTTKPRGRGTGLGLPLSLESVRLHGGDIEIDSELGHGTEVRVVLPVHNGLIAPRPRSSSVLRNKIAQILIVDDEKKVLQTYHRILQPPHHVVTAQGGKAALQRIENAPNFDAILCDLMMPEMNGKQLFERLNSDFPDIARRVVFFTGGAVTEEMQNFASNVTNRCLLKPLERSDLLTAIAETLET